VISPSTALRCQAALDEACLKVKPNAGTLVDGFDLTDDALNSALGAKDKDYLVELFEAAKREPLNDPSHNAHLPSIFKLTHRAKL
jgi:hypothetical protein